MFTGGGGVILVAVIVLAVWLVRRMQEDLQRPAVILKPCLNGHLVPDHHAPGVIGDLKPGDGAEIASGD